MSVISASCAIVTLENNASPSLPATSHSQTAEGGGNWGPMDKVYHWGVINFVQGPPIVL